jgi:NAD(P)-dependent dehydrogenase (short-subunit alcohol dehydrogenase family)
MQDKVVVVTGGANGIGLGAVQVLVRRGCRVVVADLKSGASLPAEACFIRCDVSSSSDVDAMVQETVRHFGRLDGLFANAGIAAYKGFLEMDDETWRKTLAVNLDGVFHCCRAAAREMARRGGGAIVVTSSVRAEATTPLHTAYTASKGAVSALVTALATELAAHKIRVNAVLPGAIETPMLWDAARLFTGSDMARLQSYFLNLVPMKRVGQPTEIGEAVAFLLSDAASYITGAHLPVDGGMLSQLC